MTCSIYISASTYSKINSEPLNNVSEFSLISVSNVFPIVNSRFGDRSNNRSFYTKKKEQKQMGKGACSKQLETCHGGVEVCGSLLLTADSFECVAM